MHYNFFIWHIIIRIVQYVGFTLFHMIICNASWQYYAGRTYRLENFEYCVTSCSVKSNLLKKSNDMIRSRQHMISMQIVIWKNVWPSKWMQLQRYIWRMLFFHALAWQKNCQPMAGLHYITNIKLDDFDYIV